ncbi:nucleotidyltransferase [Bacillus sp. JJ722]|uniref:nucleotidyltransferase n=1 Tax=Bacillus sp. JJ722 TaxID=3122973 RepID=UPI0030003987
MINYECEVFFIEIKDIGGFCNIDEQGYLINETSIQKINPKYRNLITEFSFKLSELLGENLHSVYIRGSVPRGLSIDNVSDLDTILVLNSTLTYNHSFVKELVEYLLNKYPFIQGIEMNVIDKQEIINLKQFSILPFMMKTYGLCVFGEDLSKQLPRFKVDVTLANEHLVNVKEQINQARRDLVGNEDQEDILDCCSWIMKIIVRAGMALVAAEEGKYTRDLYPAYKVFARTRKGYETSFSVCY